MDAVTNTLSAVGVAVSGSGLLIAGLALSAWFGFSVKDKIKDLVEGLDDKIADGLATTLTGKNVEQLSQEVIDAVGINPTEMREKGKEIMARKARFCNSQSQYYDEVECAKVDAEFEAFKIEYSNFVRNAKKLIFDGNDNESGLKWGLNMLSKRFTGLDAVQTGDGASWF